MPDTICFYNNIISNIIPGKAKFVKKTVKYCRNYIIIASNNNCPPVYPGKMCIFEKIQHCPVFVIPARLLAGRQVWGYKLDMQISSRTMLRKRYNSIGFNALGIKKLIRHVYN